MKYKIFIKAILTMALLSNSCALNAEYVRRAPEEYEKAKKALESQQAREETQRKTPLTTKEQDDIEKLTSAGYSEKVAEAIARKKPEAGGITVETALKTQSTTTDPAKKLTEMVDSVPDPFTVRDRAAAREAASDAEAEKARYLPAAGLGLPTRVPTLVAPKPLPQGQTLGKPQSEQPISSEQLTPKTQNIQPTEADTRKQEIDTKLNAAKQKSSALTAEYSRLLREPGDDATDAAIEKIKTERDAALRDLANLERATSAALPRPLKPLVQTDTPIKESEESIKKQTDELITRGLLPAEADFLMKMSPINRAKTIKQLEENQTLKPAQPQPVVEAQKPVIEPVTTQKPVEQPKLVEKTKEDQPVQKKPGFSFREFFGFGKKEESLEESQFKTTIVLAPKPVLEAKKLTPKEKKEKEDLIIKGDKLLELNPDSYKNLLPAQQIEMLNIIKMRSAQLNAAANVVANVSENRKVIKQASENLKAAEKLKGTSEEEIQQKIDEQYGPKSAQLTQDIETLKERYGVDATQIEALRQKANTVITNLELRESVRKLETAKKSQIKNEGAYFCETFASAFKNNTADQQAEISKLSIPTLRQVAPNFLKEQKALIKTLTKQQKTLNPLERENRKDLDARIKEANESIRIIESVLKQHKDKLAARVKQLKTIKQEEFVADKQKYNKLGESESDLELNPRNADSRKLMDIRIQKMNLEDKYGEDPNKFTTLKDAIKKSNK